MMYAAYGSNLNHKQMAMRCPGAKFVKTGTLKDYQLVFRGVADIEWNLGSFLLVGLWKITDDCLAALDRYEGYPNFYSRDIAEIQTKTGEINALIYYMNNGEYYPPMKTYYESIYKGYKNCGLPIKKLETDLNNFMNMYASNRQ